MERFIEKLIMIMDMFMRKTTYEHSKAFATGSEFERTGGFFILVKAAGNVTYTNFGDDNVITTTLPEGWFPVRIKKLHTTTAVDVLAAW